VFGEGVTEEMSVQVFLKNCEW